jgi:predicted metalloendopeptidase
MHFVDVLQLNGTRTLAENMADNIGLRQSWLAYKIFQSENDVQLPGLKDYTSDKLFFLAYANVSTGRANRVVSENCPDAMA